MRSPARAFQDSHEHCLLLFLSLSWLVSACSCLYPVGKEASREMHRRRERRWEGFSEYVLLGRDAWLHVSWNFSERLS